MAIAVNVTPRPEIICAGPKIQTTMDKAQQDCPALWKTFEPYMKDFPANPAFKDLSFGITTMIDEINFEYWAAMPLAPGAAVPEGMEKITIPAGDYAKAADITLKELGDAYSHIYGEWSKTQDNYAPNMQAACYEEYTPEFAKSGALALYCPLISKK